jgi:hypothetical protein
VRRKHLFEFGDLHWLPVVLREGIQGFLNASHRHMKFYKVWSVKLSEVVRRCRTTTIVDLCSGAAGPLPLIVKELRTTQGLTVSATMTDLFPNASAVERFRAGDNGLRYLASSVDASRVPDTLSGIRTLFNSFHHMPPRIARKILEDAYRKKEAICVFEYNRNSVLGILSSVTYPFVVMALMPTVRPIRVANLVLTYMLPILPIIITWDGFVSNLRSYGRDEFAELTSGLSDDGYNWEIGILHKRNYPVGMPYLIGAPVCKSVAKSAVAD